MTAAGTCVLPVRDVARPPRRGRLNIIRLRGGTNIAAAHRRFSYQPAENLDALTAA
jgi:hypothetical protein